jgi:predicted transcriptional regulator of viral defense system
MVTRGTILRVARGLYALPQWQVPATTDLITVAARAPRVVFCLLTALRIHELTTQAPSEVWIAIGNKEHAPRLDHPPLRVVRFSDESLRAGVEIVRRDGVPIRVTNVAKTVADCFKFRNKVGLDVALEALREAKALRRFSQGELWRYARINRVANVMRPYLEAIS